MLSCRGRHEKFLKENNMLLQRSNFYITNYWHIPAIKDTVILHNDTLMCIYNSGVLSEVGRTKNGQRKGYWFFYEQSKRLTKILQYQNNKKWRVVRQYPDCWKF